MKTRNFVMFLIAQGLIFVLLLNEISVYRTNSLNKELRDIKKNCRSIDGGKGSFC